ncbi:MAG: hypothetical protein AAF690_00060 [Acidobacteriota bacterium]
MFRSLLQGLLRVLFIVYCLEAGLFLVLAPWRPVWTSLIGTLPFVELRVFLAEPLARGALTGFGLVHIVWGMHDTNEILVQRARRQEERERLAAETLQR